MTAVAMRTSSVGLYGVRIPSSGVGGSRGASQGFGSMPLFLPPRPNPGKHDSIGPVYNLSVSRRDRFDTVTVAFYVIAIAGFVCRSFALALGTE